MGDEVLLLDRSGPVWTVTLNRPAELNAFDAALHQAFNDVWREVEDDRDVRAVVLTGAGRAFCAGGNLDDFPVLHADFARRRRTMRDARRVVTEMLEVHVPVVAAVNGPAARVQGSPTPGRRPRRRTKPRSARPRGARRPGRARRPRAPT